MALASAGMTTLDNTAANALLTRVRREVDDGLLPACQLAFGHNGAGGQIAWADPVTGLSFCYLTNGLDRHLLRESRRTTALGSLAAACAV